MDRRVHLTESSARRIGRAVRIVEGNGRDVPPVRFRQVSDDADPPVHSFIVTGELYPGNGGSYPFLNGTDRYVTLQGSGQIARVYHSLGYTIDLNRVVWAAKDGEGKYVTIASSQSFRYMLSGSSSTLPMPWAVGTTKNITIFDYTDSQSRTYTIYNEFKSLTTASWGVAELFGNAWYLTQANQ